MVYQVFKFGSGWQILNYTHFSNPSYQDVYTKMLIKAIWNNIKHLKLFEILWEHFRPFGTNWKYLDPFVIIKDPLCLFMTIWDLLRPIQIDGILWDHLGPFQSSWDQLVVFGNIWVHLRPSETILNISSHFEPL